MRWSMTLRRRMIGGSNEPERVMDQLGVTKLPTRLLHVMVALKRAMQCTPRAAR